MMTEAVLLQVLGSTGSPSAPYPTTKIPYNVSPVSVSSVLLVSVLPPATW